MSTTAPDVDLLALAMAYRAGGMSLVPCSSADKRPDSRLLPKDDTGKPSWKAFQTCAADEATIRQWFACECKAIAGIGGGVSGGLLIIDFDEARFYDAWRANLGCAGWKKSCRFSPRFRAKFGVTPGVWRSGNRRRAM